MQKIHIPNLVGQPTPTALQLLDKINFYILRGGTVYICTAFKQTVITPKTAERFKKSGISLFIIDGNYLRMWANKAEGYVIINGTSIYADL